MDTTDLPQGRKKSGCMKFACGGCLAIVIVAAVFAFLAWRYLTSWTPGMSAWEHLPPSTVAAFEIHDIKGLMRTGWADPGVKGLLEQSISGPELAHLAAASEHGFEREGLYTEVTRMFETWGTMYKYLGPNIAVVGFGGERGDELFALIVPTNAINLFLGDARGKLVMHDLEDGDMLYYTLHDGWLALAGSEGMLREILDNWSAKPAPFGAALGESGAFIHFARRSAGGGAAPSDAGAGAPEGEGQSLLFADPLARTEPEARDSDDAPAGRLVIRPVDGGWTVRGWVGPDAGAFKNPDASAALRGDSTRVSAPVGRGTAMPEINIASRTGPETIRRWLDLLPPARPDNPGAAGTPAWRRFLEEWSQSVAGDLALQMFKPVAPHSDGVPPLPVTSVGWTLPPGVAAADAAARFNASVSELLDAMLPASAPPRLADAVRDSAAPRQDGMGGALSLPPVAVNSAHPAWVFIEEGGGGCGWFATDPSGLPGDNALFSPADGFFASGRRDGLVLEWDVSAGFIASCREVAEDRLSSLPADSHPWADGALSKCESLLNVLLHYPRGTLSLDRAENGTWMVVDAAVPFGVRGR